MPDTQTAQPSTQGGASSSAPANGTLGAIFGVPTNTPSMPAPQAPAQPQQPAPAQPSTPSTPAQPAQPAPQQPAQPTPAQPSTPAAEDTSEDIEPEVDPAEAAKEANSAVLKSYQSALKKANNEARGLRTRVKDLETQVQTLTNSNQALQAQVVPTQRELSFYHALHEDSATTGGLGSVLYPALLWQAMQQYIQWDGSKPTNMAEALTKTRSAYPALFKQVPSINGGNGTTEPGAGGFNMNGFIRAGIKGG